MAQKVTRGYGLLEGLLASLRTKLANSLIPESFRSGKILDIGCGSYPFFLLNTRFTEKYGVDKSVRAENLAQREGQRIELMNYDIETERALPFKNDFFDVVTMLAVFEHIEPARLNAVLKEARRVLRPGGLCIITTPTPLGDKLLKVMARLRLVSPEEIEEHKGAYARKKMLSLLKGAGFEAEKVRTGHFELFLNFWVAAYR